MSSPGSSDSEIVDTSMQEYVQTKKFTKIRPKIDSDKSDSETEDLVHLKRKCRVGRIESESESDESEDEESTCEEEEDEEDRVFSARTR
jgi:hypothetical protein